MATKGSHPLLFNGGKKFRPDLWKLGKVYGQWGQSEMPTNQPLSVERN